MVSAKVWKMVRQPSGKPTEEDFVFEEEKLPSCEEGGVIVEAEWLSVDPYMRFMARDIPTKSVMMGEQVARVIESKNTHWPVGSYMLAHVGWRTHTHLSPSELHSSDIQPLPDFGDLPKSLGLGILGMPGNTAYISFLEVMQPKAGETVLVNSAGGAVGSVVVQLAKLSGCKVVAFTGKDEKVAWVKELGADHVFNYNTVKVDEALSKAAPEKINIYFDNVGGTFSGEVMPHMAHRGRVLICGTISIYNNEGEIRRNTMASPFSEALVLWKEIKIQGFVVYYWKHRWDDSFKQMKKWVLEGKVKYRETVVEGFSNMPIAFTGLFNGVNIGKAIVKP